MSEIASSETVRRWFDSAGHEEEPPEEQHRRLALLAEFSAFAGRSPDELVAGCFLRKKATGDKFASVKARQAMNESIAEFVAKKGFEGREAVAAGNVLRSFLIHNGVFIQGGAWRG
jgi:hypothetical protein